MPDDLRRLAKAATPGPWAGEVAHDEDIIIYRELPDVSDQAISILFQADWGTEEDAALVVEMRNQLPALLDERDRLRAENHDLRERLAAIAALTRTETPS